MYHYRTLRLGNSIAECLNAGYAGQISRPQIERRMELKDVYRAMLVFCQIRVGGESTGNYAPAANCESGAA